MHPHASKGKMKLHIHSQTSTLGMENKFQSTFHNGCNYLSMLGLNLNHVSKRGPRFVPVCNLIRNMMIYLWSLFCENNIGENKDNVYQQTDICQMYNRMNVTCANMDIRIPNMVTHRIQYNLFQSVKSFTHVPKLAWSLMTFVQKIQPLSLGLTVPETLVEE